MAHRHTKDPSAILDYQFDWSAWLVADTITAHTVTAEDGLTVDSTTASTTAVTAWVSGGTVGETYELTCHITTADGRQDDRTLHIAVRER
jgi:hypothetical protein